MELNMATVEERKYEKYEVYKEIDESHTDREFVKGHTTTYEFKEVKEVAKVSKNTTVKFQEDEEFAKVSYITNFEFEENEEFDRVFNSTTFDFEEDGEFDKVFRDIAKGSFTNEFEEHEIEFHTDKFQEEEEFAKVFYTTDNGY
jgi:hypothetical protein